ncbi:hypothetical protein [Paraburkholderia silvatlantica]|uniref:Uncharacterized protein n=1 Tax=Paraburkholderia silvatlantica TaxID=321895 RepID=A0ABR6FNI6_9BURK|nr:hypothetical protein [Paraburkholderia silvatlantica]MBB2928989.1 hypothetical protein [Paraburkholderia silvatlantica]PVY29087.1 hypothetical protein C7411_1156 [Paraburkholderia silvatlantica]PXW36562.1 hypothetical protein C7413_1146 [Paraburkholderia silvatlantica]TDQ98950.1 hypothetical protein C7412_104167 [Paraburkholderia silvatlantica]
MRDPSSTIPVSFANGLLAAVGARPEVTPSYLEASGIMRGLRGEAAAPVAGQYTKERIQSRPRSREVWNNEVVAAFERGMALLCRLILRMHFATIPTYR